MSFTSFHLHPRIVAGVQALGYTIPTPIQLQAMPPVLQGRDVLGLAQTGTGKTAAFVLPILQRLMQGPGGHIRALILAPTRELAEQIHAVTGALGQHTPLRQVTLYGGVGMQPQVQKLRAGVARAVDFPARPRRARALPAPAPARPLALSRRVTILAPSASVRSLPWRASVVSRAGGS